MIKRASLFFDNGKMKLLTFAKAVRLSWVSARANAIAEKTTCLCASIIDLKGHGDFPSSAVMVR